MAHGGARIQLCGELLVELGGRRRENALRGRQGRLGFAYLLLHRHRPIRRDELVAALWPEDRAPPREQALAPVLSRIRSAIAPAVLEGRDSVQLRLPEPAWIDVEVALAEIVEARHASEQHDAPKALRCARTATELLGGGLLPAHEADWLDAERERVADLRVEALELAARAAIRVGGAALPQAELDARQAVSEAPFRESARAALISVLAARGNSAEALRAYEDVRELLMEELGTVPGSELMALHTSLLTGAAPTVGAGEVAPMQSPPGPPADLPAPGALTLVERHDELRRIASTLRAVSAGHGGVLTVEGPAGIGKTRLLRETRAQAAATGFQTFDARAGGLEREFGFGVVRQLFAEVAGDPELTAGPAATVRGVLADSGSFGGTFPVLDGLHHLVLNLAARGPLPVCVCGRRWA